MSTCIPSPIYINGLPPTQRSPRVLTPHLSRARVCAVVYNKVLNGLVPPSWLSAYPSLKPLASWSRDLITRWQQLMDWCEKGTPRVFWLAGFTYPTGFLTALMQTAARANNVSVDTLSWEFPIVSMEEKDVAAPPKVIRVISHQSLVISH